MWYFTILQSALRPIPYQALQQIALLTEVEPFSEPYVNQVIFSVNKDRYAEFADYADLSGIVYEARITRPTRDDLLEQMRQ